MPKRGGGGGQRNYNNSGGGNRNNDAGVRYPPALKLHHASNDDHKRNSTRRVSFKPSPLQQNGGVRLRITESALRSQLAEDDDMMRDMLPVDDRFTEYSVPRRKGSPIPRGKFGNTRKLTPHASGWYQITIHNAQTYSKDELIRSLLTAMTPHTFVPQYWRTDRNAVVFFTDDFQTAERILNFGRNAQMSDGFRLLPRVRSGFPVINLDDDFKEKIKLVMSRRYNAQTKALDLSKFHSDPEFKTSFCALFRTPVMNHVLDVIEKNIPEMEAINLNDNNLSSMESFRHVDKRLPNLKILYLANNMLVSAAHLLAFRNAAITEVMLKGNPFVARFKERGQYISEVRRKFPKVLKLDGEPLEPQILFDMNDTSMPQARASFLCDTGSTEIVRQFLEQYFTIFDSDNRQPLLDAYHEQAMLSLSVPPASQAGRLVSYWKYNRNFRRVVNNDRENAKTALLKVGRLQIVSMLAELPKTKHNRESFTVDLTIYSPNMIVFCVTGQFNDFDQEGHSELRHFMRQFVIVPEGSGFCIRNETILITSATYEQTRAQKQKLEREQLQQQQPQHSAMTPGMQINMTMPNNDTSMKPATITSGALGSLTNSLQSRLQIQDNSIQIQGQQGMGLGMEMAPQQRQPPPQTQPLSAQPQQMQSLPQTQTAAQAMPFTGNAQITEETKMQMVQAMSTQSNMNFEWSKKCLEETNWDYNHAAFVFNKLFAENKIPPEAFRK